MELLFGASIAILSFLLGTVLRPYLTGYSAKKGENLATHEDIDKLVDQVKAVTEATKKIEAEISSGVWDKQKRWEMKREALFEATRKVAEIFEAMLLQSMALKEDRTKQKEWEARAPTAEEQLAWERTKHERHLRLSKASAEYDVSYAFVRILCSKETAEAFIKLGLWTNTLAEEMRHNPDAYDSGCHELYERHSLVLKAIRKELGVEPLFSSG